MPGVWHPRRSAKNPEAGARRRSTGPHGLKPEAANGARFPPIEGKWHIFRVHARTPCTCIGHADRAAEALRASPPPGWHWFRKACRLDRHETKPPSQHPCPAECRASARSATRTSCNARAPRDGRRARCAVHLLLQRKGKPGLRHLGGGRVRAVQCAGMSTSCDPVPGRHLPRPGRNPLCALQHHGRRRLAQHRDRPLSRREVRHRRDDRDGLLLPPVRLHPEPWHLEQPDLGAASSLVAVQPLEMRRRPACDHDRRDEAAIPHRHRELQGGQWLESLGVCDPDPGPDPVPQGHLDRHRGAHPLLGGV